MTTDDVVARAKEALEGVTEEPWVAANNGGDCSVLAVGVVVAEGMTAEDSIFTAYARTLVPELVDRIEDLQATLFVIQEARIDYDVALFRREHGGVAANRFVESVVSTLDRWAPQ